MFQQTTQAIGILCCLYALLHPSVASGQTTSPRRAALAPKESLDQIELAPGYQARLLASEPQTLDPVEVAFDDAGRLWVVEMRDYPFPIAGSTGGRIRILSDRDGDAVYESSQVFADQLDMPTGLALWKDGALVTVAGQLLFLRDLDGDQIADTRQVWLEGFSQDNEQLRANHPRLGSDGKWYIASGLRGGNVRLGSHFRDAQSEPMKIGSRDVRFDPDSRTIELVTGPAQFGLSFDAEGHRYFCSNRNPAVEVIFEQQDLVGNPLAGLVPSAVDVLPAGEKSRVFPLVDAWTTSNLHAGQFTAACGVFAHCPVATHQRLQEPSPLSAYILVCEPTGSLVQRKWLTHSTYRMQESIEATGSDQSEWLASRDTWFRPVNVALSPDGEVIIVDMHRAVIEHPQWVPEELKNRPDERWGNDAGRLIWVGPTESTDLGRVLAELRSDPLAGRSTEALAKLVADQNPWMRETATRLLLQRGTDVTGELLQQAKDPQIVTEGRIASLNLAANLSRSLPPGLQTFLDPLAMPPAIIATALRIVRRHAQHAEEHRPALSQLAMSNNPSVQFEALLALGTLAPSEAAYTAEAMDELVLRATRRKDAYFLTAAGSALRDQPDQMLIRWTLALRQVLGGGADAYSPQFVASASRALTRAAMRGGADRNVLLHAITPHMDGTAPADCQIAALAATSELIAGAAPESEILQEFDDLWAPVRALVANSRDQAAGMQAVELLSHSPHAQDIQLLGKLARQETRPDVAAALLRAWANTLDSQCDRYLVESLAGSSPSSRSVAVELISQKSSRMQLLAAKIAAGELTARQLGATALKGLTTRAKGPVREQFQKQLDSLVNSDRTKVVADYQACLTLSGDPRRGIPIFKTQCAACHRIGEMGAAVGPDISDSRTKTPEQLLASILNPNLAIDNNYFRFIVLTEDERIIEGMIVEETSAAIVLRSQDAQRHVIRRDEILQLKATGVSLMPDGLEAQIDHQAMADLIAFIKGWRYLDGDVPGK